MPFPLAHPAAVVPLKRRYPGLFILDALIIGSIVPDTAYVFRNDSLDVLSHSFRGSFVYCLPVGLVMLLFCRFFLPILAGWMPEREQRLFLPRCTRPGMSGSDFASLLVGIFSHIIWDSFTHSKGQLIEAVPQLQFVIATYTRRRITVAIVLWYLSSLLGIIYLAYAYMRWVHGCVMRSEPFKKYKALLLATGFGLVAQPIELIHHLIYGSKGMLLVMPSTLAMFMVAIFGLGRQFDKTNEVR